MIVSAATFDGPGRRLEERSRGVLDVDDADRRPAAVVERRFLRRRRQPPELVDDGERLGPVVLDRARSVDDPEPGERELEARAPRVHAEHELTVDLRQVREVAPARRRPLRLDLALEAVP